MGADGIDEVVETMQDFGLDREDWGIICEELGFCGTLKKDRPAIETKVKSAFSRQVGDHQIFQLVKGNPHREREMCICISIYCEDEKKELKVPSPLRSG